MCWNIEITFTFALLYATSIAIYYKLKPKNYVSYIIFSSFYLIMELFQMVQWMVLDFSVSESRLNTELTYVAYLLIWLQPVLFSYIG